MRTLLLSFLLAFLALPAVAQDDAAMRPDPLTPQGENLQTPPTWHIRLDRPNDDIVIGADSTADIFFVNMTPGWHVTTGPAAIFYHPASTAEGTYRAETLIHLFDPGQRNEAFGLFVGGSNLEEDDMTYDYFLIRNTGEFLIKRRTGSETSLIQDWTKHDAIQTYGPDAESSVPNTLAVVVGAENVDFHINGEQVASHPRSHIHTDGFVGLRVNHALNLHIEDFKVE
ncbi:MAG TPA: hypothetical protein VKP65_11355 [Rhodothermales bacterium]|nr:hypothetical protein [Rhodothermales bacterium]